MTTNDRCPNCDRPRATALELDAIRLGAPRADGLCYDSAAYRMCEGRRIDWRARALAAEAERDMLRGVGCDEVDGGELRGPCGACLKCARRERDEAIAASREWAMKAGEATAERDEARRLLAAVALGKLRRCETCGEHLATRRWRGTSVDVCDRCFAEDKRDAADAWETLDEEACEDLPHAAALRAAMEVAK